MEKLRNIMIFLSSITLVLTTILMAYLIYLTFYPIEIVKLNSLKVLTTEVKRGEPFTYQMDFDKYIDYRAKIKYFFVDGVILRLEESGIHKEEGLNQVAMSSRITPLAINPGEYRFRIELEYKILPWRTIEYVWESNKFTVVE